MSITTSQLGPHGLPRSTPNHSGGWHTLKSLLTGHPKGRRTRENSTFDDHAKAKALALFLTRAKLATPTLDRATVQRVLLGEQTWPHADGEYRFDKIELPASYLEDHGLIAFYGNWCTVCVTRATTADKVDPSLVPVIQALERLKDIQFGRRGLVKPHYAGSADEIEDAFSNTFRKGAITTLIPDIKRENNELKLLAENTTFSSLVSTYLWQELRKELDTEQAFAHWIVCQRVYSDWAIPIEFDIRELEESKQFYAMLITHLAEDVSLGSDPNVLLKQLINVERFASLASPIKTTLYVDVNLRVDADSSRTEIEECSKPTLQTLASSYPVVSTDGLTSLQFISLVGKHSHTGHLGFFYAWLVLDSIDASIFIDGQTLASSGLVESILGLSLSRPILQYMLLNESPFYSRASFSLFMLSKLEWCDVALHRLSQRGTFQWHRDGDISAQHFDKGCQILIRNEYLRAIESDQDRGRRLVAATEMLGERCHLQSADFARTYEYRFLESFLDGLTNEQVMGFAEAFAAWLNEQGVEENHYPSRHYRYFMGFWTLERMENAGIDSINSTSDALRTSLLKYYEREFSKAMQADVSSLEPSAFFSTLPWHRLLGNRAAPITALSNDTSTLLESINYSTAHAIASSSAIRQYLQVLMNTGHPNRLPEDWIRVARRVAEIVQYLGFGQRDQGMFLFDPFFHQKQYDLWGQFCSYTNSFPDDVYDDFWDRCIARIPLDQLFALLERTTVLARIERLRAVVAERQFGGIEKLGLAGLEKAFISACDAGHTELATRIIDRAKMLLSQGPFANSRHTHAIHLQNVWLSYEYKWDLMILCDGLKADPKEFEKRANEKSNPHGHPHRHSVEFVHWQDCDRFRRYIIAATYRETDPEKCVAIMQSLFDETKDRSHSFLLFTSRLAFLSGNKNVSSLRSFLSDFLSSLDTMTPSDMPTAYVAAILEVYRKLRDAAGIDAFWSKLSTDQQNRVQILHPYCAALIAQGDVSAATKIIREYRALNHQTSEGLGLDDLMEELARASTSELTMRELVQMMSDSDHRSTLQLTKHYSEIVCKPFDDYVAIVGQGKTSTQFLYEVAMEVANELLLRKKNLQIHSQDKKGRPNIKISQEDLINDWFVSLFDKRMAEARIGIRDQKRAGQSASGIQPGESDGFITDQKNRRIAIFEAFRLFSVDTTVISEHLNKIADYDKECLSPVLIAAYCDVTDFGALTKGYRAFVSAETYLGFTMDAAGIALDVLHDTGHIWVGMERRRRGTREVTFYHFLINLGP